MKTLDELFDEVRDLDTTHRVCMDKVLGYWDELVLESEYVTELFLDKLELAGITWSKPWYQESWAFKQPENELEVKSEATFCDGRITLEECEHIDKNWHKLRKRFDLPNNLGSFARFKKRDGSERKRLVHARMYVASYLARGIERTIPQVWKHIKNHYGKPRRGVYTKDEKKIIDICFHHDQKQATIIASDVLLREPRQIQNIVYFALHGKPEKKRIKWNLVLATKLVKLLMKHTGEDHKGLENKHIAIDVWKNIEDEFDTQAEYLRRFWYTCLHCQLFCKCDVTMRRVRKKVYKILRRSSYKVWTDIKWKDVVAEFPEGFTFQFIYWVSVRLFRGDRIHTKFPVPELGKIGLEKCKNKRRGNKRLKTLRFNEEGQLEVIKYDVKL